MGSQLNFSPDLCLAVLVSTLAIQIYKYRAKVLIHPSLFFLLVWIFSLVSYEIHIAIGFDYFLINTKYIDELFGFISFTALCIALTGFHHRKSFDRKRIALNILLNESFVKYYTWIYFALSLVELLFITGLDVALNREAYVADQLSGNQTQGSMPIVNLTLNIFRLLNFPMIIYGGIITGRRYFTKVGKIEIVYFLPVMSALLNTVSAGGRSGMAFAFTFFSLGVLLSFFSIYRNHARRLIQVFKYALLAAGVFIVYSTYVNVERSRSGLHFSGYEKRWSTYPGLAPFSGVLEYLTDHFWGYQLRRKDTYTKELEMGQTTFACFTMFSVPIISQGIGEPVSIQRIFDLKDPSPIKQKMALDLTGLENLGLTATVYFVLFDDFGFYGTFIIIALFVFFTQRLYDRLFSKPINSFWQLLPFLAVYFLWTQTIFSHHLSSTWLNGFLYPILAVEALNKIFGGPRKIGQLIIRKSPNESPLVH